MTKPTFDKLEGEVFMHDHVIEDITDLTSPFQFKGGITVAADFPTSALVQNGWTYTILADVTDNDVTKTNTGQAFLSSDEIAWNGTNWTRLGNNDDYVPYKNATQDVDLGANKLSFGETNNLAFRTRSIYDDSPYDSYSIIGQDWDDLGVNYLFIEDTNLILWDDTAYALRFVSKDFQKSIAIGFLNNDLYFNNFVSGGKFKFSSDIQASNFASGASVSGSNTGDNATNSQYSGLEASKLSLDQTTPQEVINVNKLTFSGITQNGPADPTGTPTAGFDNTSWSYPAEGHSHQYRIYAYKDYSGTKVFSSNYIETSIIYDVGYDYYTYFDNYPYVEYDSGYAYSSINAQYSIYARKNGIWTYYGDYGSVYDDGSSGNLRVNMSWSDVGADLYAVYKYDSDTGNMYYFETTGTSAIDDGSWSGASYYQPEPYAYAVGVSWDAVTGADGYLVLKEDGYFGVYFGDLQGWEVSTNSLTDYFDFNNVTDPSTTSIINPSILEADQFKSTIGTLPPFEVNSSIVVDYLNADLLDGNHASAFLTTSNISGVSGRIPFYTGVNTIGSDAGFIRNTTTQQGIYLTYSTTTLMLSAFNGEVAVGAQSNNPLNFMIGGQIRGDISTAHRLRMGLSYAAVGKISVTDSMNDVSFYSRTGASESTKVFQHTNAIGNNQFWTTGGGDIYSEGRIHADGFEVNPDNIFVNAPSNDPWTLGSGWTFGGANQINHTGTQTFGFRAASGRITLRPGYQYAITYTISNYTSGSVRPYISGSGTNNGPIRSANGTYTDIITAPTNANEIGFSPSGTGVFTLSSIYIKEIGNGALHYSNAIEKATRVEGVSTYVDVIDRDTNAYLNKTYTNELITHKNSVSADTSQMISANQTNHTADLSTPLSLGTTHTIAFWIDKTGTSIFTVMGTANQNDGGIIAVSTSSINYRSGNGSTSSVVASTGVFTGTRQRVVVVAEGRYITFYVNGVHKATHDLVTAYGVTIDSFLRHTTAGTWSANLGEVVITSDAKDYDWVRADYNNGQGRWTTASNTPNLVALYHTSEGTGTTSVESVSANNLSGVDGWTSSTLSPEEFEGATGTFTTADSKTVTVVKGLITKIV